jgi:hypothetical protein
VVAAVPGECVTEHEIRLRAGIFLGVGRMGTICLGTPFS